MKLPWSKKSSEPTNEQLDEMVPTKEQLNEMVKDAESAS